MAKLGEVSCLLCFPTGTSKRVNLKLGLGKYPPVIIQNCLYRGNLLQLEEFLNSHKMVGRTKVVQNCHLFWYYVVQNA